MSRTSLLAAFALVCAVAADSSGGPSPAVGAQRTQEPTSEPQDLSEYPEVRYRYYVPERSIGSESFGDPVYEKMDPLPAAPETTFDYYAPERAAGDFGRPDYSPIDPRWQDPETIYEYYAKQLSGDWPTEPGDPGELPKVYPEVQYDYYVPPKAIPPDSR